MFPNPLESSPSELLKDDPSDTILGVSVKRNVHWAKPEDIDLNSVENGFGELDSGSISVSLTDGSIHRISSDADPKELRKALTIDGSEAVDFSKLWAK